MSGTQRIARERWRQIDLKGWTPEHDDAYLKGELPIAAACYTLAAYGLTRDEKPIDEVLAVPADWPWDPKWWKPSPDPARNLEKAGALNAAEIDRLERKHAHDTDGVNPPSARQQEGRWMR